jgi:hypothetical protein
MDLGRKCGHLSRLLFCLLFGSRIDRRWSEFREDPLLVAFYRLARRTPF